MSEHRDHVVISIPDEILDSTTATTFRESIVNELAHGNCDIGVDCARLRFADSVGIGEIVSLNRLYVGRIMLQNVTYSLSRCLSRVAESLLPPWDNIASDQLV